MKVFFAVDNFTTAAHAAWPVQGGIPFPRGAVKPDADFRVTGRGGRPTADAEVRITGYWPDGSVKWALVSLNAAVPVNGRAGYCLHAGPAARSRQPRRRSLAWQDGNNIYVDTGLVRLTINRRRANLFESLALLDRGREIPVTAAGARSSLFADVQHRLARRTAMEKFEANAAGADFSAVLESAGTHRVVIRLRGAHVSPAGRSFAPYDMRIYAFRNSTLLRIVHTFVYDGEPRRDFLDAIGLRLFCGAASARGYAMGGRTGGGFYTEYARSPQWPRWRHGLLWQDSSGHYSMRKCVDRERNSWVTIQEGARSQGWAALHADKFQAAVILRNCWQEAPKSIEIDAANGSITASFYAGHGRPLDLRRYADDAFGYLYETIVPPASYPRHNLPRSQAEFPPVPFDHENFNARHIGKTTELFLDFASAGAPAGWPAASAALCQRPPLLRAAPEWMAASGVFGNYAVISSRSAGGKPAAYLRQCAEFMLGEQAARNWYGFMDYGDVMHSFDPARDCWRFDQGGYAWNNNEGMTCEGAWMGYLATGDERLYRFSEAMTRHVGDVDRHHAGPLAGCGIRHNVNHWGCADRERRMTIALNKRVYYFLSGDEHTLDLARASYNALAALPPGSFGMMDLGVAGASLLLLWETTGAARYGNLLRRLTESMCCRWENPHGFPAGMQMNFKTCAGRVRPGSSALASFFTTMFGPLTLLLETVNLTKSAAVHAKLLKFAELLLMPHAKAVSYQPSMPDAPSHEMIRPAAYAWRATGDKRYRKCLERALAARPVRFEKRGGAGGLDGPSHLAPRTKNFPNTYADGGEKGHTLRLGNALMNIPFGLAAIVRRKNT